MAPTLCPPLTGSRIKPRAGVRNTKFDVPLASCGACLSLGRMQLLPCPSHRPKNAAFGTRFGEATHPGPGFVAKTGKKPNRKERRQVSFQQDSTSYTFCARICVDHLHEYQKEPVSAQPRSNKDAAGKRVATKQRKIEKVYRACKDPFCTLNHFHKDVAVQDDGEPEVLRMAGSSAELLAKCPITTPALDVPAHVREEPVGEQEEKRKKKEEKHESSDSEEEGRATLRCEPEDDDDEESEEEDSGSDKDEGDDVVTAIALNTPKGSAATTEKPKILVDPENEEVTLHCHGAGDWRDRLPAWFREELQVTTPDAAGRELLQSESYEARITVRSYLACLLFSYLTVLVFVPDAREASYQGLKALWLLTQRDTRSRHRILFDHCWWWLSTCLQRFILWLISLHENPFSRLLYSGYEYWFAPPPPLPLDRIVAAACITLAWSFLLLAALSTKRRVVYIARHRFNAVSTVTTNKHLFQLLNDDPELEPRAGVSGGGTPASLVSAVRYAMVTKLDTSHIPADVKEATINRFLQEKLMRDLRSDRFQPHTTGIPAFRR